MKKRQLEIMLERLAQVKHREPRLEQYQTPARIAADVLWLAHASGEVEGRDVVDLGCGNGVFCIGAKLLGARRAVGVDVDPESIRTSSENSRALRLETEFVQSDIASFDGVFDLAIQNPPFGAQTRHADRVFVEKAIRTSPTVYSLHNDATSEFVCRLAASFGATSETVKRYKFEIPYAFEFHRKTRDVVSVVLLRFQR
ncbi:MAG: methyltransferase [Methanobacteriota archaeon]|nr:MAG: methyltransferase [Euryarchaeota archaeon]